MADRRLFITLFVGILWGCVLGLQRPAPRYSQQLMPDTSFTCRHKIIGSYYADPETDCQLFHVCVSVAGSVQDYRFLCPNDTAFDQESQTCADWYDVDCEAATLYYASDNFDLYRLGSGLESLHYDSVRNDVEPLDHLQRSESSDPIRSAANNLNKNNNNNNNGDILKGSSSSNFFNNRNNGKEIDDYADNDGKAYREEKTVQEPRRKQGVRKVARKQQWDNNNSNNAVPTTARPATTADSSFGNNNQNRNNNYQNNNGYNQQRQNTNNFAASTTTLRPYVEQNNNNNFGRNNQNNNNQRYTTYRPTTVGNSYQENNNNNNQNNNNNNNQRYTTYRPTTVGNSYQENNNNGYNNQQNYNGFNSNKFPTTFAQSPASSTARPIDYSTNVASKKKASEQQSFTNQYNQFSTQSTTPKASTVYQPTDYTGYQKNYNTVQRTTKFEATTATSPAANFYDDYAVAAARLNDAQNINKVSAQTRQQEFASQTTPRFSNNYAGSSYIPTTYSPVTKKVNNNANQGQAANRGNDQYSTGQYEATRTTNNGQYREKTNNNQQQQSSQGYRNTQSFDTTRSVNLNNNENNGQYREAQSTRAPKKATQYNNNYETKFNYNDASSTRSFDNFDQSKAVAGFSPASVNKLAESPVTLRPTTPVARRTQQYNSPSTQRPSSSATNFAQQTTPGSRTGTGNFASVTPGPFSSTLRPAERQAQTTPKPKSAKKNDYDYAYYDNAGALEYDGVDLEQTSGLRDSAKIRN